MQKQTLARIGTVRVPVATTMIIRIEGTQTSIPVTEYEYATVPVYQKLCCSDQSDINQQEESSCQNPDHH